MVTRAEVPSPPLFSKRTSLEPASEEGLDLGSLCFSAQLPEWPKQKWSKLLICHEIGVPKK